ncbi:MAG: sensor domain-containing diguanylate cyclase [Pseudomonadota bacterium]|nr:sensor domain-containing diguanylate cyclase [Pseudomonadota bacterium]
MKQQPAPIPHSKMLKIIEAQTEISKIGLDLGMVMSLTTEKAMELLDADGAVIELAEQGDMVYRAASGVLAPFLGLRLAQNSSLSGLCVAQEEILYSDDVMQDDRVDKTACKRVGINSMLVVPLKYHDSCVGVLKVASKTTQFFGHSETYILSLISDMVAAIIFHAIEFSKDELYYKATHDSLTGIGNRAKHYDDLRQRLELAKKNNSKFSLVLFDMDGLKSINDTYGHSAGDEAIKTFANLLSQTYKSQGLVARLGGDEFAAIFPSVVSKEQAQNIISELFRQLARSWDWQGQTLQLQSSAGYAIFPDDGQTVSTLMEVADTNMYRQKREKHKSEG